MSEQISREAAVAAAKRNVVKPCECHAFNAGGFCQWCGTTRYEADANVMAAYLLQSPPAATERTCREFVRKVITKSQYDMDRCECWLTDDDEAALTDELHARLAGGADDETPVDAENVLALIPEGETKGWTTTGKVVGKFGYVLWTHRKPGGIVLPGPEFTIGLNSFPFVNGITLGQLRQLLAALGIPN